ncbi:GSCFA family protein [Rhizobium sp. PP-F2F-G38]|nr:GSCFA family protein [Rhizobium sp. PP-F2F-G38]
MSLTTKANSPYQDLPKQAFWQTGVVQTSPFEMVDVYEKKWEIEPSWKIATAGSCFAQHISRQLKAKKLNVLDVEPAPHGLPEALWKGFGYDLYSARYGNIYTVHQLLQLTKELSGAFEPDTYIWMKNGRFFDAFRPSIEPNGFESVRELVTMREYHLNQVRKMFQSVDLFIFTLGLTETWVQKQTGLVFPTAPGTIAGSFDAAEFEFKNYGFAEILSAFEEFMRVLEGLRPNIRLPKILLTVSPVPLTATASGKHVLSASSYSKSVLRAVAGSLSDIYDHIDYFPSYEIITNQSARGMFYETNLRGVRSEGVASVMKAFLSAHKFEMPQIEQSGQTKAERPDGRTQSQINYPMCDEELLDAFNAKA